MTETLYEIRVLPFRQQLHDTYRVLFFPSMVGVGALIYWVFRWWSKASIPYIPMVGACVGMLPSLWLGSPARMLIGVSDHALIDAWLAAHRHICDSRGWVPKLHRVMYFDSQIVSYEGNEVMGPLVTLRKLRGMLQVSSNLPA